MRKHSAAIWTCNSDGTVTVEFGYIVGQRAKGYVNTGPVHMPLGLADRLAHDERLAQRGEMDES